jgi:hypothetical protein
LWRQNGLQISQGVGICSICNSSIVC